MASRREILKEKIIAQQHLQHQMQIQQHIITTRLAAERTRRTEEQHQAINRALDETKDNIRKTTDEARSQIPRYTQSIKNYQEQTIQAAREIADNYLDSQREIINTFQSACIPQIENANKVFWSNWMSPRQATELYANMVSSFANNMIAATRFSKQYDICKYGSIKDIYSTSKRQYKGIIKDRC